MEVVKIETYKNQVKIKGLVFEMKQYEFSEFPRTSTDSFNCRTELYDKYKSDRETSLDESFQLYLDVRKISNKDISLVTVTYHAKNTLNLAVATKNKVVEMRLNLENIPILDLIHLYKQTGEVIYSDLLKATFKVSKLQYTKTKIEN